MTSTIREYLHKSGALDTQDATVIEQMKKQYWREYDRQKKREKRSARRTYVVSFRKDELSRIRHQTKAYGYASIPDYVKHVVASDLASDYVPPNMMMIGQVRQLLAHHKRLIEQISEKDVKGLFGNRNYETLERHIIAMERDFNEYVHYAPRLKDLIAGQIAKHPGYVEELKEMIYRYDRKVTHTEEGDVQATA